MCSALVIVFGSRATTPVRLTIVIARFQGLLDEAITPVWGQTKVKYSIRYVR
jgi:hypothetical protein